MSDLEKEAKPALLPMIRGHEVILDADAQLIVAKWAIKTMLVSHATHQRSHQILDSWQYTNFYEQRYPHPSVTVWLAAYCGTQHLGQYEARQVLWYATKKDETSQPFRGYAVVIVIGKLIIQVFGSNIPVVGLSVWHEPYPAHTVVRIWPPLADSVRWPPPVPFDDARLPQLVQMWDDVRTNNGDL